MIPLARLLLVLLATLSFAVPASAQTFQYPAFRYAPVAVRYAPVAARAPTVRYGPFRLVNERTAALVGSTDERSPAAFRAMLRDYPRIATLEFVECPGTYNDRANLALGRMIRAAGLAAIVPAGGSVRSGAVELFLAGTTRQIDDDAEFAVHAWQDDLGYEANDYPANAPQNRKYLDYYREMGLADPEGFYAMTNATPHRQARWMSGAEMRRWIGGQAPRRAPRLAYLDLGLALY